MPHLDRAADIRPISVTEARQLRHTVLRPHQKPEELIFRGDEEPDALHVGALVEGKLVSIASVSREQFPDEPLLDAWRLRGLATLPEERRVGHGRALVHALIAHVSARGGDLIWCHGRTSALPFYHALGFREHGEAFYVPVTGPHIVLRRQVLPGER
jgi:ribosomal protein S18 acetylase RimI-like enzyme